MDLRSGAAQASSNVVGKYRLIAELGRGGMSEVYLAIHAGPAGFNKLVVVKLIRAEIAEDPDFVNMFLEEARLAARLNHPNVVQTNEVGQDGSRYFIAMEYLDGQPYSRVLNRLGRDRGLPLGMSLRILVDVLQGLQHAHDLLDFDGTLLGVVHRDVTPHNVFVTYDGQVKVVDFGIAKAMNSSLETRTGVLKGKVGYMAPEQARGERVDGRADVFSVGVMLWEAAVGRRLWKGLNEVAVLSHLLRGDIPAPRSMRPDISEQLEAIILRALAVDREQRYPSCDALRTDLEELLDAPGERTTLREMGRLVSEAFAEDKRRLKQIIESQTQRSNMLSTGTYQGVQLPVVDMPAHTQEVAAVRFREEDVSQPSPASGQYQSYSTGSNSHPMNGAQSARGGYPQTMSGAFPAAVPALYPAQPGSHPSAVSSIGSNPTGSGPLHLTPGGMGMSTGASTGSKVAIVGVCAGVAVIALGAVLLMGRSSNEQATVAASNVTPAAKSAPADTASAATPTETAAKNVTVKISASPKQAKVYLDGKPVATNPFETSIPRDGTTHEIKVEADGYELQTKQFTADKDVDVTIGLSQAKRVGGPSVGRPLPPPEDPMKPGGRPNQRPLSDVNPY